METADPHAPELEPGSIASEEGTTLTALQCELRALFLSQPTNRALIEALHRLSDFFGADYAVLHARLGVHLLSEEWLRPGMEFDVSARERINTVLWKAMTDETIRCLRLEDVEPASVVVTATMYDQDVEPSGGAAFVLPDVDRARNELAVARLEGVLGYLGLLITGAGNVDRLAERRDVRPTATAGHPVRLAFAIVSEVQSRHGFDLTAVGFVNDSRVDVVAISGVSEVRAANPGVVLIRSAMEECLDFAGPVVRSGSTDADDDADWRIHGQWSASLHGCPVASFPLKLEDEVVAVVAMSGKQGSQINAEEVKVVAEEMSGYAPLVPLSRAASRGLFAHAADSLRGAGRRVVSRGWRKVALFLALLGACMSWLAFGRIDYTLTVPCVVKAASRRTVSCPRDGVLAELFVRPGDHVRQGQLLAVLDANHDYLKRTQLRAELTSLDALADKALADRDRGQVQIHVAHRGSLLAQLQIVEADIELAQIRAPQNGIVLEGDLRERIGGRLSTGDSLFELARYDRAAVVLRFPQSTILEARQVQEAEFSSAARPDERFVLQQLRIAPASTVVDGDNVFLAEAVLPVHLGRVSPGMEGVAHLNVGPRSAWWVLTHRVTDWLRLNFWL